MHETINIITQDFNFPKEPAQTRLVVAMSGGVDSSLCAALLKEAGYDVIGMTLQLYDQGKALARKGACCAGQDIYDAKNVCDRFDIPHYVLDYESRFKDNVIEDFAQSYLRGETPLPCVKCNQSVKFHDLLKTAKELEADALVTGHYIKRIKNNKGEAELHRALDDTKDQSYFLFATTQKQLDFLRFPLGGLKKAQTRKLAEKLELPVADKPDSQDICFVPKGSYSEVVTNLYPEAAKPGNIVTADGEILARHNGILNYTIGQRKGLKIGGRTGEDTCPLYVIKLNPETNEVVVGKKAALATDQIKLHSVNWLDHARRLSEDSYEISFKLRNTMAPQKGRVTASQTGDVIVFFDQPEYGVAPGQACVFYEKERLLGGGWIMPT